MVVVDGAPGESRPERPPPRPAWPESKLRGGLGRALRKVRHEFGFCVLVCLLLGMGIVLPLTMIASSLASVAPPESGCGLTWGAYVLQGGPAPLDCSCGRPIRSADECRAAAQAFADRPHAEQVRPVDAGLPGCHVVLRGEEAVFQFTDLATVSLLEPREHHVPVCALCQSDTDCRSSTRPTCRSAPELAAPRGICSAAAEGTLYT